MSAVERALARQRKLQELSKHPHYGKLCKRLSESEFDDVVAFVEDFGSLADGPFEHKVLRLGLDSANKPKNINIMADILLACKNTRPEASE